MSETDQAVATVDGSDARLRLVDGMAAVIVEKGYPATTIGDIVAHAHVSRRTFYEHFADKEDCLLACHTFLADRMLDAISHPSAREQSTRTLITDAVHALMRVLSGRPNFTHTYYVAMQAAGPKARQARRDGQTRFAGAMQGIARQLQTTDAHIKVPTDMMATALVGGIAELIMHSVEHGRADSLDEIAPTVIELISAVLLAGG